MNIPLRYGPNGQKGISLIELIVVIAIMSTLITMAGIKWNSWMVKYNIEADVKKVKSALTYEQVTSVNHCKNHFITFQPTSIQPVEDTDDNGTLDAPPEDTVEEPILLKSTIDASSASLTIDKKGIISSPTSSILSNPVTVKFSSNTEAEYDCILVYSTMIRAAKQNAGGSCDPK